MSRSRHSAFAEGPLARQVALDADRFLIRLLWLHAVVAMALAPLHQTWASGFLGGLLIAGGPTLVGRLAPGSLLSRLVGAVAVMAFSGLFIHQTQGMIEMHFHVFVGIAVLLVHRDWRTLLAGAVAIAVHHVAFSLLQAMHFGVYAFPTSHLGLEWVSLHAVFVVVQTSVLVFLAVRMRRDLRQADLLAAQFDRLSSGHVDLSHRLDGEDLAVTGAVGSGYNRFMERFDALLAEARQATSQLGHTARVVQGHADTLREAHAEQDDAVRQTRGALTKVADGTRQLSVVAASLLEHSRRSAESGQRVRSGASEVTEGSRELRAMASQASSAVERLSEGLAATRRSIEEGVRSAELGNADAAKGVEAAREARAGMAQIQAAMSEIEVVIRSFQAKNQEIGSILEMIDDIAERTNLLALNAAIEAARAGDAGRGFGVVAGEVRKLAELSARSTGEIGGLIASLKQEADQAVAVVESGKKAIDAGGGHVRASAHALEQLGQVIGAMGGAIEGVSGVTGRQIESGEAIAATITRLEALSARLFETASHQEEAGRALVENTDGLERLGGRVSEAIAEQERAAGVVLSLTERSAALAETAADATALIAEEMPRQSKQTLALTEAMASFEPSSDGGPVLEQTVSRG